MAPATVLECNEILCVHFKTRTVLPCPDRVTNWYMAYCILYLVYFIEHQEKIIHGCRKYTLVSKYELISTAHWRCSTLPPVYDKHLPERYQILMDYLLTKIETMKTDVEHDRKGDEAYWRCIEVLRYWGKTDRRLYRCTCSMDECNDVAHNRT